jgi:hypothetical protein
MKNGSEQNGAEMKAVFDTNVLASNLQDREPEGFQSP